MPESRPQLATAALTIAGSDSCGGAGIQADLRTFHSVGVHGASVVTAVTAQNTLEVSATESISATVIAAQLEAVLDDLPVRAIKTGMLPDAAAIESVSDIIERRCADIPLIVDPVLIATSGASLTVEDTITALLEQLFPLATLITPNRSEAQTLTGREDPLEAGQRLLASGCGAVLLKGGPDTSDGPDDGLQPRG
ncbi:MAG: bifunctional hydroxymethylpyrimidine kinase/phosphomethylpyrimidine kinase [Xanthomonadales bacterium]|nr:bifunctional hydroxymethylpyrimidine kinase/phosphomethylpyrimidine kinase [Xanthomonadales bacterium]